MEKTPIVWKAYQRLVWPVLDNGTELKAWAISTPSELMASAVAANLNSPTGIHYREDLGPRNL